MRNVIALLIMVLGTVVPSVIIAWVGYASILSLGRNPSSAPKIMLAMLIPLMLAAGIAIIALVVSFIVFGPQG